MYGILCEILKGIFHILRKRSYPYIARHFYTTLTVWELSDLRAHTRFLCFHDDASSRFNSALLSLCVGNLPVTDGFASQMPSNAELWRCSLVWAWTNCWTIGRASGDLMPLIWRHCNAKVILIKDHQISFIYPSDSNLIYPTRPEFDRHYDWRWHST